MSPATTIPLAASLDDPRLREGESRVPMKVMGQNDFLALLVAQMKFQDPLSPKQDTEFIAQMVQFSALEQSKSMQRDMALLRSEQQFSKAQALMGQNVTLRTKEGVVTGKVEAMAVEDGVPKLVVQGKSYELDQVSSVISAEDVVAAQLGQLQKDMPAATLAVQSELARLRAQQDLWQAGGLVGRAVNVRTDDGSLLSGTVSSVQVEAGTPKLIVNGGTYRLDQVVTVGSVQENP